jgi:hypothetical protein
MTRIKFGATRHSFIGWPAIGAAFLVGCAANKPETSEPPFATAKGPESAARSSAEKSAEDDGESAGVKERNFNGAVFQVPTAWEDVPPKSGFLIAEFRIPGPGGPARLTLSTAGGDVPSNVDRWKGQFVRSSNDPSPRESRLDVGGKEATLVELFGSFQDTFGGGGAQPDSALLGVVIPLKETNYFIKLTGPRATVTEARDAFLKFAESARFRE